MTMNWPNNADGGVFRSLVEHGFDFDREYQIDFNVDFNEWPPSAAALRKLEERYGEISIYQPDEEYDGYVQFKIFGKLTYPLVVEIQDITTTLMEPYGGICESWGVLHK